MTNAKVATEMPKQEKKTRNILYNQFMRKINVVNQALFGAGLILYVVNTLCANESR